MNTILDPSPLSVAQGFAAMRQFLEAYWERGGKQSDDIATLLGALAPLNDNKPLDAAQWQDWLDAIEQVR